MMVLPSSRRRWGPWTLLFLSCLLTTTTTLAKSPSMLPPPPRKQPSVILAARRIQPQPTITTTTTATNHHHRSEAAWVSGVKNALASALAAACSKIILAPFDTIKTMQQHSRTSVAPLTLVQATQEILKRPKGIMELYAGIGVAVVGAMPSVGLYFGIYSFCKKRFTEMDTNGNHRTLTIALSAAIGNTIASASRVPYEVVKQKLQTQVYANLGDAMRDMSLSTLFPTGGIASQMLRDIPYAIVTLLTYEHLRQVWKPRAQERFGDTVPNQYWDMLVGGLSGGLGSFVTNPMDVIKTRLQTSALDVYDGSIRSCVAQTWQEGGPSAFLRGSVPRLLHKIPANAFFFLFYEVFRTLLRVQDDDPAANKE